MGLFTSSPPTLPTPKTSTDGAPIAPDRTQRAKCWEGRDLYFQCLDRNGIVDSIGEKGKAEKMCGAEGKAFEGVCATSWVCILFPCLGGEREVGEMRIQGGKKCGSRDGMMECEYMN